ncbi:hypothetical protein GCM10023079_40880 [Streptomyces chitinivorans]
MALGRVARYSACGIGNGSPAGSSLVEVMPLLLPDLGFRDAGSERSLIGTGGSQTHPPSLRE